MARKPLSNFEFVLISLVFLTICIFFCNKGTCGNPSKQIPVYRVQLIEVNHNFDQQLCYKFTQIIAWDIQPDTKLHNVGWKILDNTTYLPQKEGAAYCVTIYNDYYSCKIVAPFLKTSYTQTDPERDDTRTYWKGEAPNILTKYQHDHDQSNR